MPNDTPAPSRAPHSMASRFAYNPLFDDSAPRPSPPQVKPLVAPHRHASGGLAFDQAMLEGRRAKLAAWATMPLRQTWADAGWLRGHLKVAGLRMACNGEPATVARLKAKLRSIGVQSNEIQDAVGMTLAGFLKANPRLPLWVALGMVLEATGRFTPDAVVAA